MYFLDSIDEILWPFLGIMMGKDHLDTGDVFQKNRAWGVFVFEEHFEMRPEPLYIESFERAVEMGYNSLVA